MSSNERKLKFSLAINEALHQMMETDDSVFVLGQGVKSPWYVGNTVQGLIKKFGEERVIDTPISENAMTGAAVGASIAGMRAVVVHPRMDFMLYAFDPIINQAANWYYMNGGQASVPVVVWSIINRGGEQAAQHSQALQSIFAHVPGLKVVTPSTPYDAKGLMISAIKDDNPVVFIDDRWLYNIEDVVPTEIYSIPIGKGEIKKHGNDVTIISNSYLTQECLKSLKILNEKNIDAELIDLRSIKPLDKDLIFESVKKTGKAVIVDGTWKTCGISAEISALISENIFEYLKAPVFRMALPDTPAPANRVLEKEYYITSDKIASQVEEFCLSCK
ncbi:MAG: pyruvate dehydrogenase complex E1 component subunit beta [Pseudomonadota bacterium]